MNRSDVKVERIRGSGPGGQNKNKVASCVRLTHLPTGIVRDHRTGKTASIKDILTKGKLESLR